MKSLQKGMYNLYIPLSRDILSRVGIKNARDSIGRVGHFGPFGQVRLEERRPDWRGRRLGRQLIC